jgi:Tol biopolymer transport system component
MDALQRGNQGEIVATVKAACDTVPFQGIEDRAILEGESINRFATPGVYATPRFSPDGRRLALTVSTGSGTDIYSYDWQREIMTRLTFGGGADLPVWAPDGRHMAFNRSGRDHGIWWTRSDGSGQPQQILDGQDPVVPWSFSPDGQRLAYREFHSETGTDIWTLPLDTSDPDHPKPGKPEAFLVTPADELAPMFSPDGRWIAYRSTDAAQCRQTSGGGVSAVRGNIGRLLCPSQWDVVMAPADPSSAGTMLALSGPPNNDGQLGFFQTTNGGASWATGPFSPTMWWSSIPPMLVRSPANPAVVYAYIAFGGAPPPDDFVFQSTDGGAT